MPASRERRVEQAGCFKHRSTEHAELVHVVFKYDFIQRIAVIQMFNFGRLFPNESMKSILLKEKSEHLQNTIKIQYISVGAAGCQADEGVRRQYGFAGLRSLRFLNVTFVRVRKFVL